MGSNPGFLNLLYFKTTMKNCKDKGSFGHWYLRLFGTDICILLYQSNQKKRSGSINGQEQFDLNVGTVVNCLLTKLLDYC